MIDQIAKLLNSQADGLIDNNASAIAQELRDNPEGKLTVALSLKLVKVGHKVFCNSSLGYTRKFTDENEGMAEIPDPNQPEIFDDKPPAVSMTMITGDKSVTIDGDAAKILRKAADKLKARGA